VSTHDGVVERGAAFTISGIGVGTLRKIKKETKVDNMNMVDSKYYIVAKPHMLYLIHSSKLEATVNFFSTYLFKQLGNFFLIASLGGTMQATEA
jgi:hypothetical protein